MVRLSGDLDPCYRRLAKQLDAIPNGFPSTDSEAELLLLAKLYTPAQAEMAALLSLQPESAREVAKRVGMSRSDVEEQLQVMARTGLIQAHRQQESLRYSLMPFIVGIYEAQLARMDEELARLAEAYFVEGFGTKALSIQPSFHRVIPVEQTIPLHIDVFPYERASELLRGARSFGVRSCIYAASRSASWAKDATTPSRTALWFIRQRQHLAAAARFGPSQTTRPCGS